MAKFILQYGRERNKIDEERALFLIGCCYNKADEMLKEIKTGYIPGLRLRGSYLTLLKGDK